MMLRFVHKRGFTLIELLVVIAIIAMLLSIIVPALNKAKLYASRVVEQSNLRSLGVALHAFLNNNDYEFFRYNTNNLWLAELGYYVDNVDEIRYSPRTASGIEEVVGAYQNNGGDQWGSNWRPWLWAKSADPSDPTKRYELGSFGLNGWLYSGTHQQLDANHRNFSFGKSTAIKNTSRTPAILNSNWPDAWPRGDNALPAWQSSDSYETGGRECTLGTSANNTMMFRFYLDAAGTNKTNVLYMDNSVEIVELPDLFMLYWHQGYRGNSNPAVPPRQL